jgi:ribosome recycling factor
MIVDIKKSAEQKMQKSVEALKQSWQVAPAARIPAS